MAATSRSSGQTPSTAARPLLRVNAPTPGTISGYKGSWRPPSGRQGKRSRPWQQGLLPALSFTPSVQHVWNPGGVDGVDDARVPGFRCQMSF